MMAIATIRLKLTMMEARPRADSAAFSVSCAAAVANTGRVPRGRARRTRAVSAGTSRTAPNSSAATLA